jgi:hypothetical protein
LISRSERVQMRAHGTGGGTALQDYSRMVETLLKRLTAWVRATFPERQVYIRSDGRVQFFTFGPLLQATMAGLTLLFLGWVSFTSVNVLFKDPPVPADAVQLRDPHRRPPALL